MNETSELLQVSRWAVADWRDHGTEPRGASVSCDVCAGTPPNSADYTGLFGYYLGDGCISASRRTFCLRVACDRTYPGIIDDVAAVIEQVRGRGPVSRTAAPGCMVVQAYWNHWPCLFAQHGRGRKHERVLEMTTWQQEAVAAHPAGFLRGLLHSDGCRVNNWASKTNTAGVIKRYEYGRWQFVNHSDDIRRWCSDALDRLDIPWRQSSWKTISVSRREAVARLDELIGPKC